MLTKKQKKQRARKLEGEFYTSDSNSECDLE